MFWPKPDRLVLGELSGRRSPISTSWRGRTSADAGHEVQIFLTGEATYLMRQATADAIQPVGWPSLKETREKIVAKQIKVFS